MKHLTAFVAWLGRAWSSLVEAMQPRVLPVVPFVAASECLERQGYTYLVTWDWFDAFVLQGQGAAPWRLATDLGNGSDLYLGSPREDGSLRYRQHYSVVQLLVLPRGVPLPSNGAVEVSSRVRVH